MQKNQNKNLLKQGSNKLSSVAPFLEVNGDSMVLSSGIPQTMHQPPPVVNTTQDMASIQEELGGKKGINANCWYLDKKILE
jgi:hypothetical protein